MNRLRTLLAAVVISLMAAPVLAGPLPSGGTGPYAGTVTQGEASSHHYDNNPSGSPCIMLATTYSVSLEYAPVGDSLTLTVGTYSHSGPGAITFQAGVCAAFTITVTGTEVADTAGYAVTVTGGAVPSILCCLS